MKIKRIQFIRQGFQHSILITSDAFDYKRGKNLRTRTDIQEI